jgi:hypothetical protein
MSLEKILTKTDFIQVQPYMMELQTNVEHFSRRGLFVMI